MTREQQRRRMSVLDSHALVISRTYFKFEETLGTGGGKLAQKAQIRLKFVAQGK